MCQLLARAFKDDCLPCKEHYSIAHGWTIDHFKRSRPTTATIPVNQVAYWCSQAWRVLTPVEGAGVIAAGGGGRGRSAILFPGKAGRRTIVKILETVTGKTISRLQIFRMRSAGTRRPVRRADRTGRHSENWRPHRKGDRFGSSERKEKSNGPTFRKPVQHRKKVANILRGGKTSPGTPGPWQGPQNKRALYRAKRPMEEIAWKLGTWKNPAVSTGKRGRAERRFEIA